LVLLPVVFRIVVVHVADSPVIPLSNEGEEASPRDLSGVVLSVNDEEPEVFVDQTNDSIVRTFSVPVLWLAVRGSLPCDVDLLAILEDLTVPLFSVLLGDCVVSQKTLMISFDILLSPC
jgi:hypothetical protein